VTTKLSLLQGLQLILMPRMEQFSAGRAQVGPAVDRSIAPANLDLNIVQPTDPIVKYCFILSIDSNNNKTYKCKQCGKVFKGQPYHVLLEVILKNDFLHKKFRDA
jgi:ribosomal protein L37AE/L43A